MQSHEIADVQFYLRKTFDNNRLRIIPPAKKGAPVEVYIGDAWNYDSANWVPAYPTAPEMTHDLPVTM